MAGIHFFNGNRLEILAGALAEVLRAPPASPFTRETIVVQSKGMERWLSMELARHHGIAANYAFPFPNAFLETIFRRIVPEAPDPSPFAPDIMTWRIMKRLPDLVTRPGFENLSAYLGGEGPLMKRFQLSERIADLFDQYSLFRPEMITRWEKGQGTHWQAVLWRELVKGKEEQHRAALADIFLERIGILNETPPDFPERVSVFGISALPRFFMRVLASLARFLDIHLFLMNPCREYWGHIVSSWEIKRARSGGKGTLAPEKDLHFEKGNSLLASMGALGRDFFEMVQELDTREFPVFVDPGEESLLRALQSDILNLRERGREREEKGLISKEDRSIQVHSCHSPMREMEVLQDCLLNLFERNEGLTPGDILVMTPDIEAYAPYVQAVFDIPKEDSRWIPFSIADRSMRYESGIIETFMSILELRGGRFGAPEVLAVLENSFVQKRFGILEEDMDLIREWVRDSGVRWGIDERTGKDLGLPAFRENTWAAGLDRLLLGYALPGKEEKMFGAVLPYDNIEGTQARVLGSFVDFIHRLFDQIRNLGTPAPPSMWTKRLRNLLDDFFHEDEASRNELQAVRDVLQTLHESVSSGVFQYTEPVELPLIMKILNHTFERRGFGFGFLTGDVTFCAMLPMRSIPFKVICLVGMNGDAYPRQSHPMGFDLMARRPRPGDRSRRDDDRYLFLEALLSARETLYISYVGQDIQDNTPIPPSVLVSEILDAVEEGFELPQREITDHLVVRHRLQAFNPEYFRKGERLFSYSLENCEAARCLGAPAQKKALFLGKGLSEPDESWLEVDLEDLARFFVNPTRFLLQKRLGIRLEDKTSALDEKESFRLVGLDKYLLENRLVEKRLGGRDLADMLPAVRASGRLPHGSVGEGIYDGMVREIEGFTNHLRPLTAESPLQPLGISRRVSEFSVTCVIKPVYREKLLHYRYAYLKAGDFLSLWIHHLALNMAGGEDYPKQSMLAGLDPDHRKEARWNAWHFDAVPESERILSILLKVYRQGLVRPVHFFPGAAWVFSREVVEKKKAPEEALGKARSAWEGGLYSRGEGEDAYYQLCFRDRDPLDKDFEDLALEVFRPLLEHRRKITD